MVDTAKAFGLAMIGNQPMMELVVERSLEHWNHTKSSDIMLIALQLIRTSHPYREDLALKIFDAIFEASGSYCVLYYDAIFNEMANFRQPDLEACEWYLKIGSVRQYVLSNETIQSIDLPEAGYTLATHAAFRGRTEILLLLLRFGADPSKAIKCLNPSFKILTPKWKEVLGLILRALPYPTVNVLKNEPNVCPVPRLKHISKSVVRKVLASLAALPQGIYELPLPNELKEYVDLMREL